MKFNSKYTTDQMLLASTPTYRRSKRGAGVLRDEDVRGRDEQWLTDYLAGLGIVVTREAFDRLAGTCTNCGDMLRALMEASGRDDEDVSGTDEDNALVTILELSHRWRPEWACEENLDDLMQEGYRYFDQWKKGDVVQSLPYWERAWTMARELKAIWGVTSIRDFDRRFRGTQYLSNWIQDYELELLNACNFKAVDPSAHDDFIRDLVRVFPAKEVRYITHYQVDEDGNVVMDELDEDGNWADESWMDDAMLGGAMSPSSAKPQPAPKLQPIRSQKIGRNEPCPCGSGKKYKKCCGRNL